MKKIFFALLISSSLLTNDAQGNDCCFFQGFYVGENIGVAINNVDFSSSFFSSLVENPLAFNLSSSSKEKVYQEKIWGEIYTGWGRLFCNQCYLGTRLGVNFSSCDVKTHSSATFDLPSAAPDRSNFVDNKLTGKVRMIEYTLDGRIGRLLCDKTLAYVLIGVAFNKPTLELDTVANGLITSGDQVVNFRVGEQLQKSGHCAHFRWGLGLEHMLTYCLGLNLQYTYTNYGSLSTSGSGEQEFIIDSDFLTLETSGRANPSRQVFSMGLCYHF